LIEQETYELNSEKDLSFIFQVIRDKASSSGFGRLDVEQFLLGVSEIGMNAIRHAGGGILEFTTRNKGRVLKVEISDEGPGITNLNLAKSEGFSTIRTSLGIGLAVAERSADQMQIETEPGLGTKVILEKHRPLDVELVSYGIVSIADAKYDFNGDQYLIKEYNGDSVLLALIDGPGQGYDAYAIANSCKNYIIKNYRMPIDAIFENLNALMEYSNDDVGITASIVRITPGKMIYKGFGDTHAYLVKNGEYHSLTNLGGRLGHLKKYRTGTSEFTFDEKIQIILCSDGLSVLPIRNVLKGTAQEIANTLFDKYHKPTGDASILSLKYKLHENDY